MAGSMKSVTETGIELSNEERNLLSVAYKVCLTNKIQVQVLKSQVLNALKMGSIWYKSLKFNRTGTWIGSTYNQEEPRCLRC